MTLEASVLLSIRSASQGRCHLVRQLYHVDGHVLGHVNNILVVSPWDDEYMSRPNGVDIHNDTTDMVFVDLTAWNLIVKNLAENAFWVVPRMGRIAAMIYAIVLILIVALAAVAMSSKVIAC